MIFFGIPPIFGLKPPVTCTTSLRFHIGDVFEVWTQGVLDVGGPGNFRFLMVRCDDYPGPFGFYWASGLCKKVHPPEDERKSTLKINDHFRRKWIIEPNHQFSGDICLLENLKISISWFFVASMSNFKHSDVDSKKHPTSNLWSFGTWAGGGLRLLRFLWKPFFNKILKVGHWKEWD